MATLPEKLAQPVQVVIRMPSRYPPHRRRQATVKLHQIDEKELPALKKRFDLVTVVVIVFMALLVARLWFLQIHRGPMYHAKSENNRVRVQQLVAPRGNILDRNNRIIVTNRPSFNLVWNKEDSPDPDLVIKRLARIIHEDIAAFVDKMRQAAGNPRHLPIRLKEDVSWDIVAYVENNRLELPGISIEVLPRRDYLYGGLASHLIGYIAEVNREQLVSLQWEKYQLGDPIGKTGLEKLFEPYLRGEKGQSYLEVNALGFEQRRLKGEEPLPGDDLRLTLDLPMQQAAEEALAGRAGAVVAMEVNSGRLLTLASSPPLGQEQFIGGISHKAWQALLDNPLHPLVNKAIQGQYPPGSTYKVVTAMAGLTEGVITPETKYYCSGSLYFGGRRYGCWKRGGHGEVDLHKALTESCDVYFYQVGLVLGVDRLARYANSIGLGEKSNIILEHERPGLIPTSAWKKKKRGVAWQKGETLSIAIGQGFDLVTPLQMARMMAAVANGGVLYEPRLVDAVLDQDGKELQRFPLKEAGRVLGSARSLQLIRNALVSAVNSKHGTGKAARLEYITVAGKTGTAQVVRLSQYKGVAEDKIPYKYRDHAWFICFAPAEKPEIAVAVLVEHGQHGGSGAAPVAKAVLSRYFGDEIDSELAKELAGEED